MGRFGGIGEGGAWVGGWSVRTSSWRVSIVTYFVVCLIKKNFGVQDQNDNTFHSQQQLEEINKRQIRKTTQPAHQSLH